jgi:hypothetical protein
MILLSRPIDINLSPNWYYSLAQLILISRPIDISLSPNWYYSLAQLILLSRPIDITLSPNWYYSFAQLILLSRPIDITLSPNPHNTSCAFTVQPPFSDIQQLLVGSSEFQERPDQILLSSCMGTETTTEILGMIITHCRGLAIKIIAMVTADQVLTFTNDPAIFRYVKVPIKPSNHLISHHSTHVRCGTTSSPPSPVVFKACLGSVFCLPQRISCGRQTGIAGSHPAQGRYILYRRSITNKKLNPVSNNFLNLGLALVKPDRSLVSVISEFDSRLFRIHK